MKSESKIQMIGRKVCFIIKPVKGNEMLVYNDQDEAYTVAEKLYAISGIEYEIFPSYIDPTIV